MQIWDVPVSHSLRYVLCYRFIYPFAQSIVSWGNCVCFYFVDTFHCRTHYSMILKFHSFTFHRSDESFLKKYHSSTFIHSTGLIQVLLAGLASMCLCLCVYKEFKYAVYYKHIWAFSMLMCSMSDVNQISSVWKSYPSIQPATRHHNSCTERIEGEKPCAYDVCLSTI